MTVANLTCQSVAIKWRLKSVMADRELDYRELAALAGMHHVTMNRLVNRFDMPSRLTCETLNKLCTVLKCQPGDLLRHEPDPDCETTA